MDRTDLLLAILAAAPGRHYQPVQIQKATFLVCRNLPGVVDQGPSFRFEPYDYGPFDAGVYGEAANLARQGLAVVAPSTSGRWLTYGASQAGLPRGRAILAGMDSAARSYVEEVSRWVMSQSFDGLVRSIYQAYPEMRVNSVFRDAP